LSRPQVASHQLFELNNSIMRLNEIVTENRHLYWQRRMNENVVKPYLDYLNGLNSYLTEAAAADPISQMVQQAGGNPDAMVLPPQVQQNFVANLPPADAGPVQNFQQQAANEVAKITDPETKKGLMDRIKDAVKNPDTQQTILTAVSSIAGMAAGAASLGLGADAAKSATRAIGTGLLAALNSRAAGKSWKDSAKAAVTRTATRAAADHVGVGYQDAKQVLGLGSTRQAAKNAQKGAGQSGQPGGQAAAGGPVPAPAGVDPATLKAEWEKFVQFGQGLLNRMVPAQPQAAAATA
jgi:hypothetical protein